MTVTNQGTSETAIQIRVFGWNQESGKDELTTSDAVLASPPLATIPAGGSQIVRLVLRRSPEGREATYRILLDQIPPPAVEGVVRVVLRMSIPIFAQPREPGGPRWCSFAWIRWPDRSTWWVGTAGFATRCSATSCSRPRTA